MPVNLSLTVQCSTLYNQQAASTTYDGELFKAHEILWKDYRVRDLDTTCSLYPLKIQMGKVSGSKDETPEFVTNFLKQIQVGLNKTVRFIRTDNGTEFVNQVMSEYYEGVGIFHQKSVPRTPQQNGVVERRNRTLVEAARTMMIFSKAPMRPSEYFIAKRRNEEHYDHPSQMDVKHCFSDMKLCNGVKQQAPRAWNDTLSNFLMANKYLKGVVDPTTPIPKIPGGFLINQCENMLIENLQKYRKDLSDPVDTPMWNRLKTGRGSHKRIMRMDKDSRRRTVGKCSVSGDRLVDWSSKKQRSTEINNYQS
ncbi:putative ribonuclease H-like domain-containing protein [Tanacetum coccineum]